MLFLPAGIGELLGDQLVTGYPLQTPGSIWYVQSTTGVDAASPAGKDKDRPLATLAQAQTNATAGDIIVLLPAHVESLAGLTITKQLTIVGAGSSGGKPTATLNGNNAGFSRLIIGAAACEIRNIYFPSSLVSTTTAALEVGAFADTQVSGCYFEQGANETSATNQGGLYFSSSTTGIRIVNCTFACTAVATSARPGYCLRLNANMTDARIEGCVFDDGPIGFSRAAASLAGTNTRLRIERVSLLRGAVMQIGAASTGYANVSTVTGAGRVEW